MLAPLGLAKSQLLVIALNDSEAVEHFHRKEGRLNCSHPVTKDNIDLRTMMRDVAKPVLHCSNAEKLLKAYA